MNRILIPLLIVLWSLLYSWFWNCERKPHCSTGEYDGDNMAVIAPAEPEVEVVEPAPILEDAAAEELLFEPLDVYFESAKSSITRTEELDNFLATAKKYLAAHPDRKLNIVGHSDSDGTDVTNDRLSLERANLLKNLLIQDGFTAGQLITSGMGEKAPIASNDTPEGKAKNRRATVRLAD
ncbi:OmpA family protein [uncultured Arcticibacterium sp.]|uniref:OmpA family protein n=1 Tax=uncultured Arcticibacterium sp. TaxID=2173042 RepID=UPI0030FA97C4